MSEGPVQFEIRQSEIDGVVCFFLKGEVDIYSVAEFKNPIIASIETGKTDIVIDFTEVTFIDSTALGVIVWASRRLRDLQKVPALVVPGIAIRSILETTSLDRIFPIYKTAIEAREHFKIVED